MDNHTATAFNINAVDGRIHDLPVAMVRLPFRRTAVGVYAACMARETLVSPGSAASHSARTAYSRLFESL